MVNTTSLVEHVNKAKEEIEELEIIRDYIGNPDYYLNDNINLLRISDDDDNSHYVYIKHVSRLFNLSATKKDTEHYCPYCTHAFIALVSQIILVNVIKFNLMKVL